jgi:uncharacterized membrane protein
MDAGGIVARVPVDSPLSNLRVPQAAGSRSYRVADIDLLRGLVIVIMALDHVRDHVMGSSVLDPATDPNVTAPLFFTRWITHFCAPVFVLLAGTSAGLMTARRTPRELGAFLFKRGLWLVLLEFFIISTGWSFAPEGVAQARGLIVVPMQVIWVIGASMMILAGAQFLGHRVCLVLGVGIVLTHNVLDAFWPASDSPFEMMHPAWVALHAQMGLVMPPFFLAFVYPLLPWVGVMLLGFGSATIWTDTPERRNARLLAGGLLATAAFLGLRAAGIYGDPNPWEVHAAPVRTVIDFLNVTKYPPSLLYLLMTLGPAAVLTARADRLPAVVRQTLITYGRAPLAFYVVHIYVVHAVGVAIGVAEGFGVRQMLTFSFFFPSSFGLGLPGVYVVWVLVVAALYPLCRAVSAVKARRSDWWLSYL